MSAEERMATKMTADGEVTYKRGYTASEMTPWMKKGSQSEKVLGDVLTDYLNDPEVQTDLHITGSPTWEMCNGDVGNNWKYQQEASLWIYRVLSHAPDLRSLFYSGDTDGAVPNLGTQKWIRALKRNVTQQWAPWYVNGQVAGYYEKYEGNLDFSTIKGVGHMAPQWAREQTYSLVKNWMAGDL